MALPARMATGSATSFASPLVMICRPFSSRDTATTRWVMSRSGSENVMMSPTPIAAGDAGWTTMSAPIGMAGAIDPPVTTAAVKPRTRTATSAPANAASAIVTALAAPKTVRRTARTASLPRRAGELGRGVSDVEILRELLERVAGADRQREDVRDRVRRPGRDRRRYRDVHHVPERAGVDGRRATGRGDLQAIRRIAPEHRVGGLTRREDVGEAHVAGVRERDRAGHRVAGHERRDRDQGSGRRLVVRERQVRGRELVPRGVGRGREAGGAAVGVDGHADEQQGDERDDDQTPGPFHRILPPRAEPCSGHPACEQPDYPAAARRLIWPERLGPPGLFVRAPRTAPDDAFGRNRARRGLVAQRPGSPLVGLVSGHRPRHDFTENLEAVARGVRRLEEIRDPILREAVAAALRLRERELRLDSASRVRMRNTVLAALAPARPTLADRVCAFFLVIGKPAPVLVRGLAIALIAAGLLGGATVASADSLPDDPLYALKLAGEQLRLAVAVSPEDRAAVELSIAEHRLDEAERLATSGREDDAIIATASYGSSLADAAAELATVEQSDPGTSGLVAQLQTALAASQQRVSATATKLAADPRTANTAQVLASVSATASPSKDSPATRIADQAVAITARLATVADDRAKLADVRRTDVPRVVAAPRTDAPQATSRASSSARAIPTADPDTEAALAAEPADPVAAVGNAQTPPANASAAHQAAEKAKEAAEKAREAAEKAKRAASRKASPLPVRR